MEESCSCSKVDIQIGPAKIHIEGEEEFVAEELPAILEWIERLNGEGEFLKSDSPRTRSVKDTTSSEGDTFPTDSKQVEVVDESPESGLEKVAESLNVSEARLSQHFYIDDDGVGIRNPRDINPKYALLGYGILTKELTGETYLDNIETKRRLIDHEMVNIERWGSQFLHQMRKNGLIKDDPNTDRKRNKPFKVTPQGFDEFAEWLKDHPN